ncbi:MAG: bifunctional riboflavin kinase/FAD synthetase [Gammaproteobacteria bacterium]|nr:bifunctional riboflavin kinase/FAD synthetase [Gammaproteobacteria bacterium]MDH3468762.1 bifunctional riboflavin kinase/FAD synthetase [Gammaproteobacteria bacterium]
MELIRGSYNLLPRHHGCVASIGNYDGVHRGHQAIIAQLLEHSRRFGDPVTVITFEPHPQEYFAGAHAPPRLMRFRDKLEALAAHGVDRVVCLRFDSGLAETSAEEFVQRFLVDGIGVKHLVVGDDFRFGKGRRGDIELLRRIGERAAFDVTHTDTFYVAGERVSSSRIRDHLAIGEFDAASALLGRPFQIAGRVIHGDKRGQQWGYPTANLAIRFHRAPVEGVFAVEVDGLEDGSLPGVASLGTRPTVDGKKPLLEVFVFDFDRRIYGERIRVSFLHKLRDEVHYPSVDELRMQIGRDVAAARNYFGNRDSPYLLDP